MQDSEIVALYWRRDEAAIAETGRKYGAYCFRIAKNILTAKEDAEECVNDAYCRVWSAIPPERPEHLGAWLGRVVRNLALNRWQQAHAQKRSAGVAALLSELEDCIPSPQDVETALDGRELGRHIDAWLRSLPREDRILFVRRYWYGVPLNALAKEHRSTPGRLAQRMYRLRRALKAELEKEGIVL